MASQVDFRVGMKVRLCKPKVADEVFTVVIVKLVADPKDAKSAFRRQSVSVRDKYGRVGREMPGHHFVPA